MDIDEYFRIDDHIVTSEGVSDEEIIQRHNGENVANEVDLDLSEGEDDPEIVRQEIPTSHKIERYLDSISSWIMNQEDDCAQAHQCHLKMKLYPRMWYQNNRTITEGIWCLGPILGHPEEDPFVVALDRPYYAGPFSYLYTEEREE
ncbi:unnamed protein product [Allacma fusca]|uniref:Uncharacterized protein n=2 Tax=Allacma fusca TaxID=39272 RepID=A0A8J2IYS9_9HEXA|nr:unnamed protein product [Allacma fusca]